MKTLKKFLLFLGLAILLFLAYLVFNMLTFKSKQITVDPISKVEVPVTASENLATSLKLKTVTYEEGLAIDSLEFGAFSNFLSDTYPFVDSLLEKKTFNEFSHLYKWVGTNQKLKPIVLMAHLDVVPVIDKNLSDWNFRRGN